MVAFWAVFIFGSSGPAITAHGSLDLKQEIQIQIQILFAVSPHASLKRGSIAELWGSESERKRSQLRGGLMGRRGSMEMQTAFRQLQMLAELQYRQDEEEERTHITDQQWEELKRCRYLRIPDRDKQEAEAADVDSIFRKEED
jgi:hypothetical protein